MDKRKTLVELKGAITTNVAYVKPDDTLKTAVQRLYTADSSGVFVLDARSALVGFVAERELLYALSVSTENPANLCIKQFMSVDLFCCSPDDAADDVLAAMHAHQLSYLPVVADAGRCVGVVNLQKLLRVYFDEALKRYSGNGIRKL